ncbi:MAG: formyltransferase [Opitutales bacterium]|nr:formyltransferase [Opitutales bacterium]
MNVKDAKIVFFGFGDVGYKCLKYLLENDYFVLAVFTHDFDKNEKEWFNSPESLAKEYGIDVFKPNNLKSAKWIRKFKYIKPDLILSLYYRKRIPEEIFSQAQIGAYNLHGSYLPSYKGRAPLNWAIINGENYTGVSLHKLEKDFDTGDIIDRKKVEFSQDEYVKDIQPKVSQAALDIFTKNIDNLILNKIKPVKQSEICDTSTSYFGKRTPEDSRIDFTKSTFEIINLIRAVSYPFNGAFFEDAKCRYILWEADAIKKETSYPTGIILERTPEMLVVSTKDGFLQCKKYEILPK